MRQELPDKRDEKGGKHERDHFRPFGAVDGDRRGDRRHGSLDDRRDGGGRLDVEWCECGDAAGVPRQRHPAGVPRQRPCDVRGVRRIARRGRPPAPGRRQRRWRRLVRRAIDHAVGAVDAGRFVEPVALTTRTSPAGAGRPVPWSLLVALLALLVSGCASSSASRSPVAVGAGLTGAAGTKATVYARGVPQMSAFAFDARGRLWIARSGSSSHVRDGIYVVARAGAKPVRVVSAVRGPLGLVWVRGNLYVSTLDGVERLSGLSGFAFRRRATILRGPVAGAENNDLVLAPNGRLVMGVSATCDHCTTSPPSSGAIVSFRLDGTDLRVVASGIRAAYGLAYDGGTLYASMNQRDDLGAKTPGDWLAVIHDGENWGFPACYGQGGAACDGVPSPLGVLDPHAAAGGVAVYGSDVLVAEWVYGKVMRVPVGGGAATTLLSGFSHALPLAVAPDGSLLAGDWGTGVVYRITGVA